MESYCYLRNVQDFLSDGKTLCERRFGVPFKGPIILFGVMVEYYPICWKDQSRLHQIGKKVLSGIFLGYALVAGGIWKGDVLVADIEELQRRGNSVCQRIGFIRDSTDPRRYTGSPLTWKTVRRSRICP